MYLYFNIQLLYYAGIYLKSEYYENSYFECDHIFGGLIIIFLSLYFTNK